MTGRLSSVLAELSVLGAVRMEQLPPRRPAPPPELAPEPASAPAPEPPPLAEEDVPPVDDDVEAKIRALSEMATSAVPPSFSEFRSAFEQNEDEEEAEEGEEAEEEKLPEVAEAISEPALPSRESRSRVPTTPAARRLKEAFARLELLEACTADLRDALSAVAATIQEDT